MINRMPVLVGMSLVALVAAGLIAGPAAADQSPDQASASKVELGKQDFEAYCASCHGSEGRGDGVGGEIVAMGTADLTQLAKRNGGTFPSVRVEHVIDGREQLKSHDFRFMPSWGDWFSDEAAQPGLDREAREVAVRGRIAALVAYLASLQQQE